MYTVSQKNWTLFHLSITFANGWMDGWKYCPILIILSLLQTEIICPQMCNWICLFTYSLLLHYRVMQHRVYQNVILDDGPYPSL